MDINIMMTHWHFNNSTITTIIMQNTLTINDTILLDRKLGCLYHKRQTIQSTKNCNIYYRMKIKLNMGKWGNKLNYNAYS